MVIVVPVYEKEMTGLYYNTAAIVDADGKYLGKYRKHHIPQVAPGFWEKFYFTPGDTGYPAFQTKYARIGVQHCYKDGTRLQRQTPQQIVDRILKLPEGTRFQVLSPVVRGRKGDYDTLLEDLAGQGYVRARVDGEIVDIAEFLKRDERLARYEQHKIEVG